MSVNELKKSHFIRFLDKDENSAMSIHLVEMRDTNIHIEPLDVSIQTEFLIDLVDTMSRYFLESHKQVGCSFHSQEHPEVFLLNFTPLYYRKFIVNLMFDDVRLINNMIAFGLVMRS